MYKKTKLFLIAVMFILGVGGLSFASDCCAGESENGNKEAAQAKNLTSLDAANAGNKICPVSKEEIGEGMKPVTYEYKGKIYNLCCEMCVEKFKKDPDKYIKIIEGEKAN